MSVQSEIDRINGEVSGQETLIDEISAILNSKAGSNPKLQEKTVIPSAVQQEVMSDAEYDGLSKVTVEAIPSSVHITKIHCYTRDIYTRAPSPGGYSFYILVNDVQKADINYSPDALNEFDVDFTINLNQDFISVYPYSYASYCGFYIDGNVMYVQGY